MAEGGGIIDVNVTGGRKENGAFLYDYDITFKELSDDRNADASKVLKGYFGSNYIKNVFNKYLWTPEGVHTAGSFLLKEPLHRQRPK